MTLKFYKEGLSIDRRWYIDLPEYQGNKEDLQMVMGADILLDIISGGGDTMSFAANTSPDFEGLTKHIVLTKIEECSTGGAWYYVSQYYFNIWLCDVTKFIFAGKFPDKIFCTY